MKPGGSEIGALKTTLRSAMRNQLKALSPEERAARSERICARIVESPAWKKAKAIVLFSPLRTEPQVGSLHSVAEHSGKATVIIPSTLRTEAELVMPFTPELILVPGLAFSQAGHRLGRGGGFFDRFLAGRGAGAFKLGVCFAFQLLEAIPVESHDVVVNAVMTD